MVRMALPTELLLAFDDAAHDVGYRSAPPFIAFALHEALDGGSIEDSETNADWGEGMSTVEVPSSVYDSFREQIDSDDDEEVTTAIRATLVAYARDSNLLILDRDENGSGYEDEMKENLRNLGYID